ncbi:hypothetical protein ABI59_01530 [Acidobacteria bacterium Mor1]|nr:hypothetical protein ABI59_01530 [Acidobacteria bacterium Mor1]
MTESIQRFKQFVSATWVELKKTTWPSQKEVTGTTIVVIVTVFICALFLFVVDQILSRGMEWILSNF